MKELPRLAIFGATGAVGTIVLRLLEERKFPYASIRFFGSPTSQAGRTLKFAGVEHPVEPLIESNINDIDLAIASTPDEVAEWVAPRVVQQGGVLVDESAFHRMQDNVPLVVPEVNADTAANHKGVVASPNCSTTQLVVCLHPLHQRYGLKRVIVSTYQAASGAGHAARMELIDGTLAICKGNEIANKQFESPLPMNLWPKIGGGKEDGSTSEETKMVVETRKILNLPKLPVFVTCVRVPVVNCHSESVVVETEKPINPDDVRTLFESSPGITVQDDLPNLSLPTPRNCHDQDDVFVGRIRRDPSVENGIGFWCVSDNLRKGAATNAVQIAELLVSPCSATQ